MGRETVRVNVTISTDLHKWYSNEANLYGCSVSSLMAIALAQYKQNQEGLNALKDINGIMGKIQDLSKKVDENK
jgi:hypothetical protein